MERAPLPPHERTWRHPSELAADRAVALAAERPSASARIAALLTGTAGVVLIGVAVLSITPRAGDEPTATGSAPIVGDDVALPVSLTSAVAGGRTPPTPGPAPVVLATPLGSTGLAVVSASALVRAGAKHTEDDQASTITEVTVVLNDGRATDASVVHAEGSNGIALVELTGGDVADDLRGVEVAVGLPDPRELVTVLADDPFVVTFDQVDRLAVADGTAVVNADGELVGLCTDGGGLGGRRFIPIDELAVDATTAPD